MPKNPILVLTSTYPRWKNDTVPQFVESLCIELKKHGLQTIVLAPHFHKSKYSETLNGISVSRFKYAPDKMETLAYGGGLIYNFKKKPIVNFFLLNLFLISQFFNAISLVIRNKCNVIHAHWLVPQGLIAILIKKVLFWKNISVLITIHGSDVNGINNKLYMIVRNWISTNADSVSTVSQAVAKKIHNKSNIIVAPMGIETNTLFSPSQSQVKKNILFVGRLVKQKGCDVLLNAFAKTIDKNDEHKLNIIGDGPELENLMMLSKELKINDRVDFVGSMTQEKLSSWYRSALIFIMPSVESEGFGLVVAEAMSCECIVIASKLDSITEIIDDEVDGLLVKPGSVGDLTDTLSAVLENPKYSARLAKNARNKILKNFDWSIAGKKYAEIIFELAI